MIEQGRRHPQDMDDYLTSLDEPRQLEALKILVQSLLARGLIEPLAVPDTAGGACGYVVPAERWDHLLAAAERSALDSSTPIPACEIRRKIEAARG